MTPPTRNPTFWYPFATAILALFFYFWILQDSERFALLIAPLRHTFLFLDLHCVLAAIEGHAQGIDVMSGINPIDTWGRGHAYSPLWLKFQHSLFEMRNLGLLGYLILVIFLIQSAWLLKPSNRMQAVYALLLLASPAVALGLERGNSDVIIFILLYLPFLIPMRYAKSSKLLLWSGCYLASILKYYPVAAFSLFITTLENRRSFLVAALTALLGGTFFFMLFKEDLLRSFDILARPQFLWIFGKDMMFVPFLPKSVSMMAFYTFLGLLVTAALYRAFASTDLEFCPVDPRVESLFLCSSLIYVLCFVANTNYDYRLIFLIPTVPYILWLRNFKNWKSSATLLLVCYLLIMWCEIFFYLMLSKVYGRIDIEQLIPFTLFKGFLSWTILGYHLFFTAAIYRNQLGYKFGFFPVHPIRGLFSGQLKVRGSASQ